MKATIYLRVKKAGGTIKKWQQYQSEPATYFTMPDVMLGFFLYHNQNGKMYKSFKLFGIVYEYEDNNVRTENDVLEWRKMLGRLIQNGSRIEYRDSDMPEPLIVTEMYFYPKYVRLYLPDDSYIDVSYQELKMNTTVYQPTKLIDHILSLH